MTMGQHGGSRLPCRCVIEGEPCYCNLGQGVSPPTKAYYVERVARTVTVYRVYADTAREAREKVHMHGEALSSETFGGRWGKVRREPADDRNADWAARLARDI